MSTRLDRAIGTPSPPIVRAFRWCARLLRRLGERVAAAFMGLGYRDVRRG